VTNEFDFRLLGPLIVLHDGAAVPIPKGKQRAVLATLLLRANQFVSFEELIESLWGTSPPASARVTVQNYVKRLRQVLGDDGRDRIATSPRGYTFAATADEVDAARFSRLVQSAHEAAESRRWPQARGHADAALSLWRGEPLADVASDLLTRQEVPRLTETRLQAMEIQLNARLQSGAEGAVISDLRSLTHAHPLRESLHGMLMLALQRTGRQGEALAAYQDARRVLIEELGSEPGFELQRLHERILTADPALIPAQLTSAAHQSLPPLGRLSAGPVPRQLPAATRHFTGREHELSALTGLLDSADGHAQGTVVISAIGGTAGVGKTALAVQWAHQVSGRFPDGQLYVNLRGYDPDKPVSPEDALAGFLRALGVPGQIIPLELDERASQYRSLVANRRIVTVLDNAWSAEQVRPLLPGSSSCVTVVTSRDALSGLAARDGAVRLSLDLLSLPESVDLLRELIGARVNAEPQAAITLARQCCRLPLALRVTAEIATARPDSTLIDLTRELANEQQKLSLMDAGGDERTAVRTVFSWSYQHLDADCAWMFRLVSLHPGSDFDAGSAAALAETTPQRAARTLAELARGHLLQHGPPGRYSMHDLLRAYARELVEASDGESGQHAALSRLFEYYTQTAAILSSIFPPRRRQAGECRQPPGTTAPATDPAAALAWLDAERASMAAAIVYMSDHGWPDHATHLASTISAYLEHGGHLADAITIHRHALRAAHVSDDKRAEADRLNDLGVIELWQGRYQPAAKLLGQALALFEKTGDRFGWATALGHMAVVERRQGSPRQAADHQQQVLEVFRQIGDEWGQASTLNRLGVIEVEQRHYQDATEYQQQAISLYRQIGDQTGEAESLMRLGVIEMVQSNYPRATERHEQAIALFRFLGARINEAEALEGLGDIYLATGDAAAAYSHHSAALGLAEQTGDQNLLARAHHGLARASHAMDDAAGTRRHREAAFAIFHELGAPEAEQVRGEFGDYPELASSVAKDEQ
jgi:DNA-binding SARP family transcriptional activator/tetratricopeptide (TPR) repeat protein